MINITKKLCERCEVEVTPDGKPNVADVTVSLQGNLRSNRHIQIRHIVCHSCADDINTHLMEIRAGDIADCMRK